MGSIWVGLGSSVKNVWGRRVCKGGLDSKGGGGKDVVGGKDGAGGLL